MLDHCANPQCAKPLRYLRDGRIFVFQVVTPSLDGSGKRAHRLEHYWLCGTCSRTLLLEKTQSGIQLEKKPDPSYSFVHVEQARAS